MKQPVTIFWFRRDLRLEDNHGLYQALKHYSNVLPIFIFDPEIIDELPQSDARLAFIHDQLKNIKQTLEDKFESSLLTLYQRPEEAFKTLLDQYAIKVVITNTDYEPYAIARDTEVTQLLKQHQITFLSYKDQVIFEQNEVVKADGTPYVVYTPYMRRWRDHLNQTQIKSFDTLKHASSFLKTTAYPFHSLEDLKHSPSRIKIPQYKVDKDMVTAYEATRNFPAIKGTSKLGPHLRFGTVSIRKLVDYCLKFSNDTFLKELIWREFFMQILWHFPHTAERAFKSKYDRIAWRNNSDDFKAWCEGKTGYPLVDAGMRELNETGFMHNRVRMLVGSFLCKHLLIDWRWGEAYFAEKLNDYEMASNVGNWQWVAGCGVDAAPYFRIFNPTTQIQKFDKQLQYINKWVQDLNTLEYPQPVVDHKLARERCLKTYKAALD